MLLSFCLVFGRFQRGIAYNSAAYKKACIHDSKPISYQKFKIDFHCSSFVNHFRNVCLIASGTLMHNDTFLKLLGRLNSKCWSGSNYEYAKIRKRKIRCCKTFKQYPIFKSSNPQHYKPNQKLKSGKLKDQSRKRSRR